MMDEVTVGMEEWNEITTELARLHKIEAALPKTADGVAIVPGIVVFWWSRNGVESVAVRSDLAHYWYCLTNGHMTYTDCYSTEAAARPEQERPPCAKSCCGGM